MEHTISVVIPAFNSEDTIKTSINSVLNQDYPADEIIVVDDGSTDGTAEAALSFGNKIIYEKQANQGSAAARQAGTNLAKSEYIAYLDADDWWPANKISALKGFIKKFDIDFLLADLTRSPKGGSKDDYLDRNTSFFPWFKNLLSKDKLVDTPRKLYKFPQNEGLEALLRGFPAYPSTMLLKKSAILEAGGWDAQFKRCQDFDIALRMARKFPLYFHHEIGAILGLHEVNSDVDQYVIMQTLGDIKVLSCHFANSTDSKYSEQLKKALARKHYSLAERYKNTGDPEKARKHLVQAMKLPGRRLKSAAKILLLSIPATDLPRK